MSNGRRHVRALKSRHDPWYVTQFAVAASEDDAEDARRQSHDRLIGQLGPRRRSGVSWRQWPAREAPTVLAQLGLGPEYDDLLAMCAEHRDGGVLVMAMCKAVR